MSTATTAIRGGYPGIYESSAHPEFKRAVGASWAGGRCAFGARASVLLRLVACALEGTSETSLCVEVREVRQVMTGSPIGRSKASSAGAGATDIGVNGLIVGIGIEAARF